MARLWLLDQSIKYWTNTKVWASPAVLQMSKMRIWAGFYLISRSILLQLRTESQFLERTRLGIEIFLT